MKSQINESIFYHIYPLGMCNAKKQNDFCSAKTDAINQLTNQLEEIKKIGINCIYIGPLFESTSHGYDTVDYYFVDRRLGNNEDFSNFVKECHNKDIKVIVDAVFNHTGRDFFAFKDIQQNGRSSKYVNWYKNINFDYKSPYGDNFCYEGWAGCMDLVKLDVDNQEVKNHIFCAVEKWINEFNIDGLRLDAADVLTNGFMSDLKKFCVSKKQDFWLLGEVVHGDYNNWVNQERLDSVTNYELYKGMWSSFNDNNFFEVAYSLNRQFGPNGIYKNHLLYNFLDNHDVNRIASTVNNLNYLVPLYAMLYTVPGIPSIYYGSQWGIKGKRNNNGDYELRPAVVPFVNQMESFTMPEIDSDYLQNQIAFLSKIRKECYALKYGRYEQILVKNKQFAFMREYNGERVVVIFNCDNKDEHISLSNLAQCDWYDLYNQKNINHFELNNFLIKAYGVSILKKVN